jgi:Flp pilus assembly protein TadG
MPGRRLSLPRLRLGFLADRRAGIGMMAAIAIPVLLGVASLVGEYGHSLLIKTDDQRIADLAAYAGALAYNTNNTTASMTSAAQAVVLLVL